MKCHPPRLAGLEERTRGLQAERHGEHWPDRALAAESHGQATIIISQRVHSRKPGLERRTIVGKLLSFEKRHEFTTTLGAVRVSARGNHSRQAWESVKPASVGSGRDHRRRTCTSLIALSACFALNNVIDF